MKHFNLHESSVVFPVGTGRLEAVNGTRLPADSHKAVVRKDKDGSNPRVIGVVGKDYKILKHANFFGAMETAVRRRMDAKMIEGSKVETTTSFDGAWVQREYIFPAFREELKTSTNFKTEIGFRIIGWNSYDGSSSAGCASGLIDFFCHNGAVSGAMVDMTKRRHTSGLTADQFEGQVYRGIERVAEDIEMLRKLAETPLDIGKADQLLRNAFSERRAEKLLERVHAEADVRGMNVFALHSALTYYSSHNSEEFKVRNTGNDNAAKTLYNREAEVRKVMPQVIRLAA